MNIDFLTSVLNNMENPKKENRTKAAFIVLENPDLIKFLVELTFEVENKISIKAAWILEWICTHHGIEHIIPYLDTFCSHIKYVTLDSATRPCAKICEHLANAYASKKDNPIKTILKNEHIDLIIETGFDWLITPQKIAVKAYTMQTLYLFGNYRDWVHPELSHIIQTQVIQQSKGCEVRGKKILELIKKY